jgi:RNA-directed DNA polymerase
MEAGQFRETVAGTPQGGVISPLLANLFLSAFDREWGLKGRRLGVLVRYADDFVILCPTARSCEDAERLAGMTLASLGLGLHPDKTRKVDLRQGRGGFDFLGCHFRARVSGRLLEQGKRRFFLHRWPSVRSMKRLRARVRLLTRKARVGVDVRVIIRDLNPLLRGWANYFRTGNAADKFTTVDRFVMDRLRRLLANRYGWRRRSRLWSTWPEPWFREHGLYQLRGTIRYPGAA